MGEAVPNEQLWIYFAIVEERNTLTNLLWRSYFQGATYTTTPLPLQFQHY